jgi:hypothetical protein
MMYMALQTARNGGVFAWAASPTERIIVKSTMSKPDFGKTKPDLVTIRTFVDELEANLARSRLQAAGIDSMLGRDDCGGMRPSLSWAQGIRLVVRSDDAERAAAVLSDEAKNSNR